jgi:pimeloyl-ACP methyl ester carboxylesterase
MKKIRKLLFVFLSLVVLLGGGGIVYWNSLTYPASEIALKALQADSDISVGQGSSSITFQPVEVRPSTGYIFYPGAGVDFRAYAPVLRQVAARGYFVALIRAPLNLALFDINAADEVISHYPEIGQWAIGGHSLGGVAAATYAAEHQDVIRALVLWASYPADDRLKDSDILILSIHGSNDGLATDEQITDSKALLPAHAQFLSIEGGNHSQFGSYGFQNGDNRASISAEGQWERTAEATVQLLDSLSQ